MMLFTAYIFIAVMLFPITLLICSVSAVQGYSSGAGDAVCDRALEPGHGATSKDADSSPYSIKADASQYSPNGTVDGKRE